jgi:hypothetical protein
VEPDVEQVANEVVQAFERELELYEPMRGVIAEDWSRDRAARPVAVEITVSSCGDVGGHR